jgi:hypothetical protein
MIISYGVHTLEALLTAAVLYFRVDVFWIFRRVDGVRIENS